MEFSDFSNNRLLCVSRGSSTTGYQLRSAKSMASRFGSRQSWRARSSRDDDAATEALLARARAATLHLSESPPGP